MATSWLSYGYRGCAYGQNDGRGLRRSRESNGSATAAPGGAQDPAQSAGRDESGHNPLPGDGRLRCRSRRTAGDELPHHHSGSDLILRCRNPDLERARAAVQAHSVNGRVPVRPANHNVGAQPVREHAARTFFRKTEADSRAMDGLPGLVGYLNRQRPRAPRSCGMDRSIAFDYP